MHAQCSAVARDTVGSKGWMDKITTNATTGKRWGAFRVLNRFDSTQLDSIWFDVILWCPILFGSHLLHLTSMQCFYVMSCHVISSSSALVEHQRKIHRHKLIERLKKWMGTRKIGKDGEREEGEEWEPSIVLADGRRRGGGRGLGRALTKSWTFRTWRIYRIMNERNRFPRTAFH